MPKTIETKYLGSYKSGTNTPFNIEPITVGATLFTPVDLLVSAYKILLDSNFTNEQKEVIESGAKFKCHVGNSLDKSIDRKYAFFYHFGPAPICANNSSISGCPYSSTI